MSKIYNGISKLNSEGEKILSIFLTAGYPDKKCFTKLVLDIIDSGADMIEIGIPFSDPLADGPVIETASRNVLEQGISIKEILNLVSSIRLVTDIPIILMGYANPVLRYGTESFMVDAKNSGADGLIVPDIPLEEYHSFFCSRNELDIILLATPTSSEKRIKAIDQLSNGFLYCVSITGTTGVQQIFSTETVESIRLTYNTVSKNKMLLGFGISGEDTIKQVKDYCDGFIVGSAVIKSLKEKGIPQTLSFIRRLKSATL